MGKLRGKVRARVSGSTSFGLGTEIWEIPGGSGVRESYREDWIIDERQAVVGMVCSMRPGKRVEDFYRLQSDCDIGQMLFRSRPEGRPLVTNNLLQEVRPKIRRPFTKLDQMARPCRSSRSFLQALNILVSTSHTIDSV